MFAAVKAKDEKAFLALQPSHEQTIRSFKNEIRGHHEWMKRLQKEATHPAKVTYDTIHASKVDSFLTPGAFAIMDSNNANGFRYVVNRGEEKGIVWAAATITGIRYDTTVLGEGQIVLPEAVKRVNGTVDFSVGDSIHQLLFYSVAYFPFERRWFAGSFGFSDDEVEVVDVVVQNVQEEEPPPPPPLPRPPVNLKNKPVSTKTKKKFKG